MAAPDQHAPHVYRAAQGVERMTHSALEKLARVTIEGHGASYTFRELYPEQFAELEYLLDKGTQRTKPTVEAIAATLYRVMPSRGYTWTDLLSNDSEHAKPFLEAAAAVLELWP